MHGSHLETFLAQTQHHVAHVGLSAHEDHHALLGVLEQFVLHVAVLPAAEELLQEADEHRRLLGLVADAALLVNLFGRLRDGDLHHHGVPQYLFGQLLDLGRHRGAVENLLAVVGQQLVDGHNVVVEAHIEHTIGLIEYEE